MALPYIYLRHFFYHDITARKPFRRVKKLAALKQRKTNRKMGLIGKLIILLPASLLRVAGLFRRKS